MKRYGGDTIMITVETNMEMVRISIPWVHNEDETLSDLFRRKDFQQRIPKNLVEAIPFIEKKAPK